MDVESPSCVCCHDAGIVIVSCGQGCGKIH